MKDYHHYYHIYTGDTFFSVLVQQSLAVDKAPIIICCSTGGLLSFACAGVIYRVVANVNVGGALLVRHVASTRFQNGPGRGTDGGKLAKTYRTVAGQCWCNLQSRSQC